MIDLETAIKAVEIYEARHPRPSHVTQMQAAEMIGMSRVTIGKMIRQGRIRLNEAGLIPITEVDRVIAPKAA